MRFAVPLHVIFLLGEILFSALALGLIVMIAAEKCFSLQTTHLLNKCAVDEYKDPRDSAYFLAVDGDGDIVRSATKSRHLPTMTTVCKELEYRELKLHLGGEGASPLSDPVLWLIAAVLFGLARLGLFFVNNLGNHPIVSKVCGILTIVFLGAAYFVLHNSAKHNDNFNDIQGFESIWPPTNWQWAKYSALIGVLWKIAQFVIEKLKGNDLKLVVDHPKLVLFDFSKHFAGPAQI